MFYKYQAKISLYSDLRFPYVMPVGTVKGLENYRLLNGLSKEISLILNTVRHSYSDSGHLYYKSTQTPSSI